MMCSFLDDMTYFEKQIENEATKDPEFVNEFGHVVREDCECCENNADDPEHYHSEYCYGISDSDGLPSPA